MVEKDNDFFDIFPFLRKINFTIETERDVDKLGFQLTIYIQYIIVWHLIFNLQYILNTNWALILCPLYIYSKSKPQLNDYLHMVSF